MFGHLLESKLQYYIPEKFWKVFKLWGQGINIREQQDALDFYQALIDQVDEQVKVNFQGVNQRSHRGWIFTLVQEESKNHHLRVFPVQFECGAANIKKL